MEKDVSICPSSLSVRAYTQGPGVTICNCKQPSCLDEQVFMALKQLV